MPERRGSGGLFSTFLFTGFRDQEVMDLNWSDVNLKLHTIRVTRNRTSGSGTQTLGGAGGASRASPWIRTGRTAASCSPVRRGIGSGICSFGANRWRSGLRSMRKRFYLKTFRSTYATRMLRAGSACEPRSIGWAVFARNYDAVSCARDGRA